MYSVKEIFYTLQGEGAQAGRAAVFCRFAGCNLWTGREADRHAAICQFCDTDFVGTDGAGGGKFATAEDLARTVRDTWQGDFGFRVSDFGADQATAQTRARPLVICTGGEPLLQLDADLVAAFQANGFEVAIETNGTRACPGGVDWICVSPKATAELVLTSGDELKLVFPQADAPPENFAHLDFKHFYLQPMDGAERELNTQLAVKYCLAHSQWKLSLQTHKFLGIP